MRRALAALVISIAARGALAHEVRPAYLQLRQTGIDSYDILWKAPARSEGLRPALDVELPAACAKASEPRSSFRDGAITERWSVTCAGGLPGGTIRVAGRAAGATEVLVRLERLDGTTQAARLTPSSPSFLVEAAPGTMRVAGTYARLGLEHILIGVDHLLFLLALLLLVRGWKRLVATITAFTAAHSLTLTAATLGWVHAPQPPIEACIALSIAFVAREVVRSCQGQPGWTERWPWLAALTFGLLHGFGFAGALREVGLPPTAIPVALLFFNVGVEIGQLLFIAVVVACMTLGRRGIGRAGASASHLRSRALLNLVPGYAIGVLAMFWVIQRISSF